MRSFAAKLVLLSTLCLTSCVVIVGGGSISMLGPDDLAEPREVTSPMKAFLLDGSTVVYDQGAVVTTDSVVGAGVRYSVALADTTGITSLPLDSVIGVEAFQGRVNTGGSILLSVLGTGLAAAGSVALFKALFGSCPTFYASAEQGGRLQAEAFSYSIAPLLEGRDLDALGVAADEDGVVRLELRNEALETHYINHLQILSVDHAPGTVVLADDHGSPIGARDEVAPSMAVDRAGRDVRSTLVRKDDITFASSEDRIRAASDSDAQDHIDLTFDRPDANEAVVVLRLRNSLLTTVLFYDLMIAESGVSSLDWIGQDMARIGTVVELGRWFQDAMGLRVLLHDGDSWQAVGRVSDTGPIAWEEVGIRIPVPDTEQLRIRLSFLTDAWRIDQASLAGLGQLGRITRVPVARILDDGEPIEAEALAKLAEPDEEYLATYPGTSVDLEFEPPPVRTDRTRSYMLSSQGYYTEWVRTDWLRNGTAKGPFRPDTGTVESLMGLWLEKKDSFEADFFNSKIPVR